MVHVQSSSQKVSQQLFARNGEVMPGDRGLCNRSVTQWVCRWWLCKMRYCTAETGPEPPRQFFGLNTSTPAKTLPPVHKCTVVLHSQHRSICCLYKILDLVLCSKTGSTATSTWILEGFKTFLQTIQCKVSRTSLGALFPSPNSLTAWNSLPNTDLTFTLPQMERKKRCYQNFLVVWTSISVLFTLRQY